MRFSFTLMISGVVLMASGCTAHRFSLVGPTAPPVAVSQAVRNAAPNDYLRVSFLPPGVPVTSLSRPGALRAFATATPLYSPPLKLADLPAYSGLVNNDANVLVAMRCRPPQPDAVDAVLATWPNVFQAIERDVPLDKSVCAATPANAAQQVACYASAFVDAPSTAVPTSLASTFQYAAVLFDPQHTALAKWLKDNYGIFPAFSGNGYSIRDSYYLDTQPMTSQQILVKSISSEFILKNVDLATAGCRCISVPPYPGRSSDPLDPDFISSAGGNGTCSEVKKLAVVPSHR